MAPADHDALRDLSGLFVLGTLDPEERARFQAHLAECDDCAAEVRSLRAVTEALPYSVPQVDPPAALRHRVMSIAGVEPGAPAVVPFAPRASKRTEQTMTDTRPPRTKAFWAGWITAAAALVVAAVSGIYASNLKLQLEDVELRLVDAVMKLQASEQQVASASAEVSAVRTNLALLTAPDVIDLKLAGNAPAADATARAFISRTRGLLFAASSLPPLPPDRTYQLWYLTRGAPVSAGLVRPDEQGNVTAAFDVPADAPQAPTGFAVSLEPDGGVPSPTGPILLASR